MPKWLIWVFSILTLVVLGIGLWLGISAAAKADINFWKAFLPNLFSNVIGVSIGALVAVVSGLSLNKYYITRAENKRIAGKKATFLGLLEVLVPDLSNHETALSTLSLNCPPLGGVIGQSSATTQPSPVYLAPLAVEYGGKFLTDQTAFEIMEAPIYLIVSNYFSKINELNDLIKRRNQLLSERSLLPRGSAAPALPFELTDSVIHGKVDELKNNLAAVKYAVAQKIKQLSPSK